MRVADVAMLAVFAVGMGAGQLLLKLAAVIHSTGATGGWSRVLGLAFNWAFVTGGALYAVLLVYWVWLLTFIPLSRAYPFTLLSLVVAALGGHLFFGERLTGSFLAGLAVIGLGLVLVSWDQ